MEESNGAMFPYELCGEITVKSFGRHYAESNVCDLVSILIQNGYKVLIERPAEDYYLIRYGR